MAETLVLAELTIDSSGVVSGVGVVDKAFAGLGKRTEDLGAQTQRASNPLGALTQRMFSLRSAAVALLGSFTVAGGVLAIKNFGEEALRANEHFGLLDASLRRFNTDLLAVVGNLPGATAGIDGMVAGLNRLDRVLLALRRYEQSPSGQNTGAIMGVLFGATSFGAVIRNLSQIGALIDKMFPPSATGGAVLGPVGQSKPWEILGGLEVPAAPGAGGKKTPAAAGSSMFLDMWQEAIDLQERTNIALEGIPSFVFTDEWRDVGGHLFPVVDRDAVENWQAALDLQERQNEAWETAGTNLELLTSDIEAATAAYEMFGSVATAAYEAVGAAAASGVLSQTAATRIILALHAVEAVMEGKIEVARAAAAAATGNIGSAVLHGIAAGLFFSAAAFYAHGAIAGPAGASGGGGGQFAAGFGQPAPQPRQPQITVINEGTMMAFTPDQLVRWITEQQRRSGER